MAIKIGHASHDERNKYKNGKAGDNTGNEVFIREWYIRPWNVVLRPKDKTIAEKIAVAMEKACANNHIGYDQNQRTTLYAAAKAAGWDLSKITTDCETDCSALVAVCVNCAGIAVSKDMYSGNEKAALLATGKFEALSGIEYLTTDKHLKRGDILLLEGHHTAIALEDGTEETVKQITVLLPPLKKGDKNNAVRSLQNLLINKFGINCGAAGADGDFGAGTEKALKQFQSKQGLESDGICGGDTWNKLITK